MFVHLVLVPMIAGPFHQVALLDRIARVNEILSVASVREVDLLRPSDIKEHYKLDPINLRPVVELKSPSVKATITLECGHVHEISMLNARQMEGPVPSNEQIRQKAERIAQFLSKGIELELESVEGLNSSSEVVRFHFRGKYRGVSEFGGVNVSLLRKNGALDYLTFGFDLLPPSSVIPRISLASAQNIADEQFVTQFHPAPNSTRLSGRLTLHTPHFLPKTPYSPNTPRPVNRSKQTQLYYQFQYSSNDFISQKFPGRPNEGVFKVYVDAFTGEVAACQEPVGLKSTVPTQVKKVGVAPNSTGMLTSGRSLIAIELDDLEWTPATNSRPKGTTLLWKSGTNLCKAVWESEPRRITAVCASTSYAAVVSPESAKKIDDWIRAAR